MADKLWNSSEEFFESLNDGMMMVQKIDLGLAPDPADLEGLKSLLATYMTGVFDAEKLKDGPDPEMREKIMIIRMTMLAAYNLGRQREKSS
jgi:hypothetical protein